VYTGAPTPTMIAVVGPDQNSLAASMLYRRGSSMAADGRAGADRTKGGLCRTPALAVTTAAPYLWVSPARHHAGGHTAWNQ